MVDLLDERDSLPLSEDEEKPDKKAAKQLKKLEKALETRVLDPWERYRALSDVFEGYTDVAELLDRKTRFGLIILGALNAINLVVVLRPDLFEPGIERPWLGVYVGCYMALSLYLFVKAIDTLKPRFQGLLAKARGLERAEEESAGLRFMGDVAAQSAEGYYETWHQAQIGQLNRELAQQAQQLARVNLAKFAALNRLYKGLLMLVFLTAGLIMMIAYRVLMG